MHGPQGVLGGEIKVPGVTKESGEGGGEQFDQAPAGVRIAVLRRAKPRIECLVLGQPHEPSQEQSPMTIEQLDAGQTERQASRPLELFIRQRCAHRSFPQR